MEGAVLVFVAIAILWWMSKESGGTDGMPLYP